MQSIDIHEHPSFISNRIALRLGVIAALVAAFTTLTYPRPQNFYIFASVAVVCFAFYLTERSLLPRVKTLAGLDLIVLSYCVPILFAQWFAIWSFPIIEVSTGAACMMVISGLLFNSKLAWTLYAAVTAISWIALKAYLGVPVSRNELVQLLAIAPIVSIVARFTMESSIAFIQKAKENEEANVADLKALLSKLKEEVRLRESSEAQLQRVQRYESLGLMAAGVAHDFNNTLAAINLFSEVIHLKSTDTEVKCHAKEITNAVKSASGICKQMLIYAGKSTSEMKKIDLVSISLNLLPLVQASCPKRVSISIQSEVEVAYVLGNASQVQQVLMNLVVNGVDSIAEKGSVEMWIRKGLPPFQELASSDSALAFPDPIPTQDMEKYFVVEVRDTGVGMAPAAIPQIFDPYFTTKGEGHGFGLSMVLGIAKSHNAILKVASQLNHGTTFRIYFPPFELHSGSVAPPSSSPSIPQASNDPRILVVDDDEMVRHSLANILKVNGWKVVLAASGEEALEEVQRAEANSSEKYQAMIIDFKMPKMNGLETLRKMRSIGCVTPAILCSGYLPESLEQAIELEFQGFLQKPYQSEELEQILRPFSNDLVTR